jgi:selenocysteine-specific elongation factor
VGQRYAQLRLHGRAVAARGDRVILRTTTTIGGGRILDPAPPRRLDIGRLELLERGDPESIVRATVHAPMTGATLRARGLLGPEQLAQGLVAVRSAGGWFFSDEWLGALRRCTRERLEARAAANPLDPGLPLGELLGGEPWAAAVVDLLDVERRAGKAYLPGAAATLGDRAESAARLERELAAADVVKLDDPELARFLEEQGRLRRVGDGFAVSPATYDRARETLVGECEAAGRITLARFRDLLGVGRREAQLLLERFDADGLTRRIGDERVLRRRARTSA